jgi:hypothetical protein
VPVAKSNLHDWTSRILLGGASACFLLFVADILIFPMPVLTGDKRLEIAILTAEIGLPAVFVFGAVIGLSWRRSQTLRLSLAELIAFSLSIAVVAAMLVPAIARHRSDIFPVPLYELVPGIMVAFFGFLALAGTAWFIGYDAYRWLRSQFKDGVSS